MFIVHVCILVIGAKPLSTLEIVKLFTVHVYHISIKLSLKLVLIQF